jgi:hypothetical protein
MGGFDKFHLFLSRTKVSDKSVLVCVYQDIVIEAVEQIREEAGLKVMSVG